MAQLKSKQPMNQNYGSGGSNSRYLSQPPYFSNNCLPPLSPLPHSESSLASSSSVKDASMDEVDVSSPGLPVGGSSCAVENAFRGSFESLPPRKGHRRSNSDVPLGFNVMIQTSPQLMPISGQGVLGKATYVNHNSGMDKTIHLQKQEINTISDVKSNNEGLGERRSEGEIGDVLFRSYMNLDSTDRCNVAFDKVKGSIVSGRMKSGADRSNTEGECLSKVNAVSIVGTRSREGIKRSAAGDPAPTTRHFRSLSVDSAFGNLHFGDSSPKLPTSVSNHMGQFSPCNSGNENSANFSLEFGNGEFSEAELKKIMADERLAEIALSDPKRAKRILANRQSAARSKERKLRYISELEHKVQTLQNEATTLSAQLTILKKDFTELTNQNNELIFRLEAIEQQANLRDALHKTLTAEVEHLKLAAIELGEDGETSSCMLQQMPMKHHVLQMQHGQSSHFQQLSVATSESGRTASVTPASA